MMHVSLVLTTFAILSSAAVPATRPTPAPDSWTPLSFSIFNDCTGESINVTGSAHLTTRVWTEGDRVFIRGHINMNLAGVGVLSGRQYRLHQNSNSMLVSDVTTGASVTDQVYHLSLISSGRMPNAVVTMNGTVLLDPAGNSFVIPKKWIATCK